MNIIICIIFNCCLSGQVEKRDVGVKTESELYQNLFRNYNQIIRPAKNGNETVVIYFELFIAQLVKVDEVFFSCFFFVFYLFLHILVDQIMETKLWLKQSWVDNNYGLE